MRGRKPIPTTLKVLHGNPGRRPLNASEPKPRPEAPPMPKHLDKIARLEWKRIVPELERLGLLGNTDRALFEAYCTTYSAWVQLNQTIAAEGYTTSHTNKLGATNIVLRPEVSAAQKYAQILKSLAVEFGLSPSSRTRISLPTAGGDEGDEMEDLLLT